MCTQQSGKRAKPHAAVAQKLWLAIFLHLTNTRTNYSEQTWSILHRMLQVRRAKQIEDKFLTCGCDPGCYKLLHEETPSVGWMKLKNHTNQSKKFFLNSISCLNINLLTFVFSWTIDAACSSVVLYWSRTSSPMPVSIL